MLIFKIIGPLLILSLSLIQFYLDHKYSDKRTKKYKRFKTIFLVTVIITSIITSYVIFKEDSNANELLSQLKTLKATIESQDSTYKIDRRELEKTIVLLREDLRPFLELATKTYPNLEPDSALQKLSEEIFNLRERTTYLEQSREFKPLDDIIKKKFIDDLVTFRKKYNMIKYSISCYEGNRFRVSIANQLSEIYRLSGITNYEVRSESRMRYLEATGLKIIGFNIDQKVFKEFYGILSKYYFIDKITGGVNNSKVNAEIDPNGNPGIALLIYGDPIFEPDGRIKF